MEAGSEINHWTAGSFIELFVHRMRVATPNVKEHAILSVGASVDHGVDVKTTEDHVNRTADRGCCVSTC